MCSGPWQGRLPACQAYERSTNEQDDREGWGLWPPGEDVSQEQGWLLVSASHLFYRSVGSAGEVGGKIQIVVSPTLNVSKLNNIK